MNHTHSKILVLTAFLLPLLAFHPVQAGNGGGLKSNTPGTAPTTSSSSPTSAAPVPAATTAVPAGSSQRLEQLKQIETFTRSVLPAIIAAEHGDESSLTFLKDRVTYFTTVQQACAAAKESHVEATAVIKKLDPTDISIDTVKNEARVNVIGNLLSGSTSTPTLWVVSVKINPASAPQPFSVSQIIVGKLPG